MGPEVFCRKKLWAIVVFVTTCHVILLFLANQRTLFWSQKIVAKGVEELLKVQGTPILNCTKLANQKAVCA